MLKVTCPSCLCVHETPSSMAGSQARCRCGAVVQIPTAAAEPLGFDDRSALASSPLGSRKKLSSPNPASPSVLIWVVVGVVGLGLVAAVVLLLQVFGKNTPTEPNTNTIAEESRSTAGAAQLSISKTKPENGESQPADESPPPWNVRPEPLLLPPLAEKFDFGTHLHEVGLNPMAGIAVAIRSKDTLANSDQRSYWIERADLLTGKRAPKFEVVGDFVSLRDVSVDGSLMILQIRTDSDRWLEMWKWTDASAERVVKWPPENHVDAVRIIDEHHVLFLREERECWRVPEMKLVYSARHAEDELQLSHLRGYATTFNRKAGRFEIFETRTNKLAGVLSVRRNDCRNLGFAYRADGQVVAALVSILNNKKNRLLQWDLKTGKLISQADMDLIGGKLVWCSKQFLLVRDTLVEAQLGIPVWQYMRFEPLSPSSDNRLWVEERGSFYRVELPTPVSRDYVHNLVKTAPRLVASGERVAVDIQCRDWSPEGVIDSIREIASEKLREAGFVVDSSAATKFLIDIREVNNGGSYSVTGGRGGSFSIPDRSLIWQASFLNFKGSSVQAGREHSLWIRYARLLKDGQDPQRLLQTERWEGLLSAVKEMSLPKEVFLVPSSDELPKSIFHPGGEEKLVK